VHSSPYAFNNNWPKLCKTDQFTLTPTYYQNILQLSWYSMKSTVFLDVIWFSAAKVCWCFTRISHFHLQCQSVSQARVRKMKAANKANMNTLPPNHQWTPVRQHNFISLETVFSQSLFWEPHNQHSYHLQWSYTTKRQPEWITKNMTINPFEIFKKPTCYNAVFQHYR
jgi:hypothetical protein